MKSQRIFYFQSTKNILHQTIRFYEIAINVWTVRDPLKRETARKNNLNWLEFFTLDEFLD